MSAYVSIRQHTSAYLLRALRLSHGIHGRQRHLHCLHPHCLHPHCLLARRLALAAMRESRGFSICAFVLVKPAVAHTHTHKQTCTHTHMHTYTDTAGTGACSGCLWGATSLRESTVFLRFTGVPGGHAAALGGFYVLYHIYLLHFLRRHLRGHSASVFVLL
jgi:hypothetical protein